MDTLGALALATEAPTDHLMRMKPVGRRLDLCIPGILCYRFHDCKVGLSYNFDLDLCYHFCECKVGFLCDLDLDLNM